MYYVDWCPLTGLIATAAGDDAIRLFKLEVAQQYSCQACLDWLGQREDGGGGKVVLVHTMEDAHSSDVNCVRWNPTVGFSCLLPQTRHPLQFHLLCGWMLDLVCTDECPTHRLTPTLCFCYTLSVT